MIVYTNYISIFYFFFRFVFYNFLFCFIVLLFPYFRGNSLNSRADLEFKEFRLFSTMIKKKMKFYVFSKNPNGFFFFHDDFSKKKSH